ncbi:Proteophosphoglycan ppg4 [Mycena kentingensis (nom. inval.)]|nr:Proteophosphoglycan ppg4 [Mycena kentingensis (nom. inval.)]
MGVIRRRGARSSQGRHARNGAQGHRGQRRCREAVRARRPPSFNPRQRPSPNDDDDELPSDWRCSPEDVAKMSSKEKRQLRNKISARNFRVRCKAYISNLEEDLAQRDALVELCHSATRSSNSVNAQLAAAQKENRALRAEIVALKQKLLDLLLLNAAPPSMGCFTNVYTARMPDIRLPCKQSSLDCLLPFAGSWTFRQHEVVSPLPAVSIQEAACAALVAQALLQLFRVALAAFQCSDAETARIHLDYTLALAVAEPDEGHAPKKEARSSPP